MKTLRTIALLTVMASMLFAVAAQAQPTLGVYFGPNKMPWKTAAPNQPFDIWVIARNIQGTIDAVEYKLTLPTQVIITNYGFSDGSIHIGSNSSGYAVGLGECIPVFGEDEVVVQHMTAYVYTLFPQFNVTLTAATVQPNSTATAPQYSDCLGNTVDFTVENGILVGTTVATEAASFGAVKALY